MSFAPGTGAGLAEVARLITELELKDELTPGLTNASKQATAYGTAADKAQTKTGLLGRSMKGASGAMSHFASRAGQATMMLGAGGLLGGILGVVAATKNGVDMAAQWGRTTERLNQLTGAGIAESSRFADAYDKLGISQDKQIRIMGFLSKTLGNWNVNRKQARQIEKDYGFDLIGTNGKMKNALQITQDFTGYFNNKHIPSYQKASLGAKLFGRGWTDMIPVFEKGKKAMRRAMGDAMELAPEQLKDLRKWRDAQRDLNDEVGDLQVKIGLAVLPALTQAAKGITQFVNQNERKIRLLFGQGLEAAQEFAGFVVNDVAPTLVNLAQGAEAFWNSIPGPLRDILLKGFVADRAVKFAFGFSITGLATDALKDAIGGGLSRVFGRGSSPATPMYVKPVGVPGGLGGGAGAGAPGGGMGRAGKGLLALEGVMLVGAVASTVNDFMVDRSAEQAALAEQAKGLLNDQAAKSMDDIVNMTRLLKEASPTDKAGIQTFASKELQDALRNVGDNIVSKIDEGNRDEALKRLAAAQEQAIAYGWTELAAELGADIEQLRVATLKAARPEPTAQAIKAAMRDQRQTTRDAIQHLFQVDTWDAKRTPDGKRFDRSTDHTAKAIREAAREIKRGIAQGGEEGSSRITRAIDVLKAAQRRSQEQGNVRLARSLGRDISVLRRATSQGLGNATQKLGTIAAKPPPNVTVTTNVTAQVGIRDVERATTTINRYGRGPVAV